MDYSKPQFLVDTEWLALHLHDPQVRVLDCSVYLRPVDGGVRPDSGYDDWAAAHIPGALYADLLRDLSDRETSLPVMMPPAAQFEQAMRHYGISNDSRVVLYDNSENLWATRVWWMLRAFGFEQAAVLNGGLKKWRAEGRVLTDVQPRLAEGDFMARPQKGMIRQRDEVLAALEEPDVCLINGLSAAEFRGEVTRVARPGRIPGSRNVPASSLLDPASNTFLPADRLHDIFSKAGAFDSTRVITYCGGGIAASAVAFALALLGAEHVGLYDGSLVEWAADPSLPMERD